MALMQSCCCWRSVRRGSFACGFYTGIYFALLATMSGSVINDEHSYMMGNTSRPESMSFLEPASMSHATVGFSVSLFLCSCLGILSSFLLIVGLFKDRRTYLLPWIVNVSACSLIDVTHTIYLFTSQRFNPITALMYTLDFFLLCLNVYALLCVISQYQEYMAGRGRAIDDCEHRVPEVRYTVPPTTTTATSCLTSKRTTVSDSEKKGAAGTRRESPATENLRNTITTTFLDKNLTSAGKAAARKHVQFPDETRESISNPTTISTDDNSILTHGINTIMEKEMVSTSSPPSFVTSPKMSESDCQTKSRQQISSSSQAES